MKRLVAKTWHDESGATAAEFALVLPLLLLFLFGIIDVGRLMYTWNQAEKATQMGARMAVVTDMVPGGLYTKDWSTTLGQGVPVTTASFGEASCTKPASGLQCECNSGDTCPTLTPYVPEAFNAIVTRMQAFLPTLTAANVAIDYTNSGLGYAGDPNGADVAPLITVRIVGMEFRPITLILFDAAFDMPEFRTGLTMEDGSGSVSN